MIATDSLMLQKDGTNMHEYSCEGGNRNGVYMLTLLMCALASFAIATIIDWLLGGIHILLDFLIFILSFSPLSFWLLFTKRFSRLLLKIAGIRNCSGIYKGTLKSNYDNFTIEYPITVEINHQFREMGINLKTPDSESCSKTASIKMNGNKTEIVYTYENSGSFEKKLNMHVGTCILTIEEDIIEGKYYTHPDRKNYGTFTVS